MRKKIYLIIILCFAGIVTDKLYAQDSSKVVCTDCAINKGYSVGLKIGTTGPGLEVSKKILPTLDVRLGGNYYSYGREDVIDDWKATVKTSMTIANASLLVNWYCYGTSDRVRLTGGLYYNFGSLEIEGGPNTSYSIGSYVISPHQIGKLNVKFTTNAIQPYLGIGYGYSLPTKKLSFNFDLGFSYQGSPKVDLSANGLIAPTASEEQEAIIEENISDIYLYPVLSIQLNYRIQ